MELVSAINAECDNLSDLVGLSEEKTDALIKNDVKELAKLTELEQILTSRHQRLSRATVGVLNDIAMVLNLDADGLTLKAVAEAVKSTPDAPALFEAVEKIAEIADRLKALNEKNTLLLQHSVDFVEFSMNVIRTAGNSLHSGEDEDENVNSFFNSSFDAKQ